MDESTIKVTKGIEGLELNSSVTMMVWGYDTSLPDGDIKSLLSEHFSSCGEITRVVLRIVGDGVAEKVHALSGCDMGEWIVHTVHCCANSDLSRGIIRGTAFPPGITQRKKPRMTRELKSSFFLSVTR